jgi:type II restriction enzyme SfiI
VITGPSKLTVPQIEEIEKQTLRWVTQSVLDYAGEIFEEFHLSPDDADGVAEDVTQESMNRLAGFTLDKRRLYGTVDYRRARYVIFPELITRQALFLDSKAEKSASSGRIQINQSSMRVVFQRPDGTTINVPGGLGPEVTLSDGLDYLTTTVFAHYHYATLQSGRILRTIKLAALPNGRLESSYIASPTDNIWNVGPDAPTLGEAQRGRISFRKLKNKKSWRVQTILFASDGFVTFTWDD